MNFRLFLETEEEDNVNKLLAALPEGHRKLLNGYKFKYTPGNTLDGDNEHIGYIFKNRIVVAAPWNYSRAFTTLHEIAHLVWEQLMNKKLREEWNELVKNTKQKQIDKFKHRDQKYALKQNAEEIFCMSYAAHHCTHAPAIWMNDEWDKFIDNLKDLKKSSN